MDETGVFDALSSINQSVCTTPLENKELASIAKSVSKYDNDPSLKWKELTKLQNHELTVPTLTMDYIPENLRPWVTDISDRMQVPLEFLAAPVITALSSVIGRQIGIYPKKKDDWFVVPNLWGAVIARPGFFKSPAISEAMRPLDLLVKKARIEHDAAKVIVKSKEEMLKAKIDGIKDCIKKATRKGNDHELTSLQEDLEKVFKELDSNVTYERRYKTNDATTEKLACLLNENPKGLLVIRDELSGWLQSMQKSGREGDREFYLEAWNRYGSFSVDRIGRGSLHVPALCLAVFGGLQPGKLEAYIRQATNGAGDDGLLQRFQLLVFPDTAKKWKNVDRKPKTEALEQANDLFSRLAYLKVHGNSDESKIAGLHFSDEAQKEFDSWREKLEERLRSKHSSSPVFESHLAKYRSLIPSLALIFHLIKKNSDTGSINDRVEIDSLRLALRWAKFLEEHAKKVYFDVLYPNIKAAQALANKIAQGLVRDQDSLRTIYRHHWSLLDSIDKLESAISVLEDANWVQVESVKIGNKPTEVLRIHPSLGSSELLAQFR